MSSTPAHPWLVAVAALAAANAAHAQATLLSDVRRLSATASAGSATHADAATPSSPFAPFSPTPLSVHATSGTTSTTASASQSSSVSPSHFIASGAASASGQRASGDPGNAQSSSSFFISFRLASPTWITLDATLTLGQVSKAQLLLQGAAGQVSFIRDAQSPQPISLHSLLPAGDYTLVAFAAANISLFPGSSLADGCSFALDAALHPPCPADFDQDGFVDFFDFDAFVACFEGDPCPPGSSADFDQDGFVDFFDFDAFVTAFEAGC